MIGLSILFKLKDEVKSQRNENTVKNHMITLVEEYKKVPGLKE